MGSDAESADTAGRGRVSRRWECAGCSRRRAARHAGLDYRSAALCTRSLRIRSTLGHVRAQTPNASRRDAGTRKLTDLFDERPVLLPEKIPAVVSFARRILRAAEVEVYMPSQLR